MYSYGPPHMAVQKQDDQHEHTFSSYVRIRDVVLKTCLGRWTIGRSGERGSGISVLPVWHDDDNDDDDRIMQLIRIGYIRKDDFRIFERVELQLGWESCRLDIVNRVQSRDIHFMCTFFSFFYRQILIITRSV